MGEPTQQEKNAVLAEKMMGWHVEQRFGDRPSVAKRAAWIDKAGQKRCSVAGFCPHENRNQLAMLEAELTEKQWLEYVTELVYGERSECPQEGVLYTYRQIRTADPTICVGVLYEMFGEGFRERKGR